MEQIKQIAAEMATPAADRPTTAAERLDGWSRGDPRIMASGYGPFTLGFNRDIQEVVRAASMRAEQGRALDDALRETAAVADELAFWRYQAIWGRAYMLHPEVIKMPFIEDAPAWKEAARQLEAARLEENRERTAHAEAPRDPGAT